MKKFLVVDDSVMYRTAISQVLSGIDGGGVVTKASHGKQAVEILQTNQDFDLITCDIEMPIMDGIETIREIRKMGINIPIIVFSAVTLKGAEKTMEALNVGANDFLAKVSESKGLEDSIHSIKNELYPRVQALIDVEKSQEVEIEKQVRKTLEQTDIQRPDILLIGSSTGGPDALTKIFEKIEVKFDVPILLVQHMPPLFTEKLAAHLDRICPHLTFKEAKSGENLEKNLVLVAPGDFHMKVGKGTAGQLCTVLNQEEKENSVRPAVDVTLRSLDALLGKKILFIILTGMGEDGARGGEQLFKSGHQIIAQNEESCAVYGMPKMLKERVPEAVDMDLMEIPMLLNKLFK